MEKAPLVDAADVPPIRSDYYTINIGGMFPDDLAWQLVRGLAIDALAAVVDAPENRSPAGVRAVVDLLRERYMHPNAVVWDVISAASKFGGDALLIRVRDEMVARVRAVRADAAKQQGVPPPSAAPSSRRPRRKRPSAERAG